MDFSRFDTEFSRFLVTGGINTLASYLLYWLLLLVVDYNVSFTLAYLFGIGFSYVLQSVFVFRRDLSLRKFMAYPSVYVVQYLTSLVLLNVTVEWAGVPARFALLVVIVITIPLTFIMSRFIIKSPVADDAGGGTADSATKVER